MNEFIKRVGENTAITPSDEHRSLDKTDLLIIGGYSNVIIIGFVVFLVKMMQLNFAKFYLTRMYMVIIDVSWLIGFAVSIQLVFAYSYYLCFDTFTLE